MEMACPACSRLLTYSGDRPSFCGYCGKSLNTLLSTVDRPSAPLTPGAEAETLAFTGASSPEPPPKAVGGYRLLRRLGGGGMGDVYEAEEGPGGRRVAVKLIGAAHGDSADAVERFRREGRLASALSHPRCVFVYAADEDAGRPYIVMELMPGRTLQQLVDEEGPLSVEQAVAKALDVIDGLREAHAQGVVHRDVKPSNCFLEADGRVKVGDFGLAKSLTTQGDTLTRTGAFLGTMLYASPEQIRRDPVDSHSDQYSTAATLYFLLTGRAPFQGGDAVATVARVVTEDAPSMRSIRPELPARLDRIVLRGLERDPARRWRDLDEFRLALLPFAPGRVTAGRPGLRFAAYFVDGLLFLPASSAIGVAFEDDSNSAAIAKGLATLAVQAVCLAYFVGTESRWGCSLGKRLFNLRVAAAGLEPPRLLPALYRNLVLTGPFIALGFLVLVSGFAGKAGQQIVGPIVLILYFVGIVLPISTMRQRNGYRGLHELLSGTRVVLLPSRPGRRFTVPARTPTPNGPAPADVPTHVGPFTVRGSLSGEKTRLLLAEDATLGRLVVLWLRPAGRPSPVASQVVRPGRWRWIGAGRQDQWDWDAFLAPVGVPLPDLTTGRTRLPWTATRQFLEQLTAELTAAIADGTLPETLNLAQVHVQPSGQVLLLDVPLTPAPNPIAESSPQERSLALLAAVARRTLEGSRSKSTGPIQAPTPHHAAVLLRRLTRTSKPYASVDEFAADLAATSDLPAEVTRSRRAAALLTSVALQSFGLITMLSMGFAVSMMAVMGPFIVVQTDKLYRPALSSWIDADLALGAVSPDPGVRLAAAARWRQDQERLEQIALETLAADQRRQQILASLTPPDRILIQQIMNVGVRVEAKELDNSNFGVPSISREKVEAEFVSKDREKLTHPTFMAELERKLLPTMAIFPALWILWALVARDGYVYRLHGITLVRSNGRPAGRLRCVWRGLLVWTPIVVLLTLSLHWSIRYWSSLLPGVEPASALPWLAQAAWWLGVALLPLWLALALRYPRRGPHDYLAGTYVVPR